MATRIGKNYRGVSREGFEEAAEDAVKLFHKDRGRVRKPTELRVLDMYVTVVNPIRDYIVVLGTTG